MIPPNIKDAEEASHKARKGFRANNTEDNPIYSAALRFREYEPYFYQDDRSIFWLWNNEQKRYVHVTEHKLTSIFGENTGTSYDSVISKHSKYVQAMREIGIEYQPKPMPKSWIAFKNGIFDLYTGEIRPNTSEWFNTNTIPHNLGRSEETPFIDSLIKSWVPAEQQVPIMESLAYSLYSDYPIHLMFALVGSGRNGKSRYLELMERFLGDENVGTLNLERLQLSRFEIFSTYRKLVIHIGETNDSKILKTDILKELSGGDRIKYEGKGVNGFEDKNYGKIFLATNSLPPSYDESDGWFSRWLIFDFPNQFVGGHNIIDDVTEQEYENLARKCCTLLQALLVRRTFTNQGTIEERRRIYKAHSEPIDDFIETCIEWSDVNDRMRSEEAYDSYIKFADKRRMRRMSERAFSILLAKKDGFVRKRDRDGSYFEGVRLKSQDTIKSKAENGSCDTCVTCDTFLPRTWGVGEVGEKYTSVTSNTSATEPVKTSRGVGEEYTSVTSNTSATEPVKTSNSHIAAEVLLGLHALGGCKVDIAALEAHLAAKGVQVGVSELEGAISRLIESGNVYELPAGKLNIMNPKAWMEQSA